MDYELMVYHLTTGLSRVKENAYDFLAIFDQLYKKDQHD